ncbi:ABC transporter permease [Agromyces fucosus]|uniref:ABC transporter permease n=1 Tax=Agromyces fucosus TaxID=41985 RepID=UPI002692E425
MTEATPVAATRRGTGVGRRVSPVPGLLVVPAAIGIAVLALPLVALLLRLDWSAVPEAVTSPAAVQALSLSLATAGVATVCCLLLGIPLALVIARAGRRTAAVLRALVTLPLVLPPLVGGIALLALLGRTGLFGESLALLGVRLPFTTAAVVIAQVFVALPFLVISVEGSMRAVGTRFEAVGAGLGASPLTVFRRLTLPLVGPGVLAGTVLCFARALGEFGATALFAGNTAGVTRTMPLAIYTAFNGAGVSEDTAIALSLMLVAVAIAVLLVMRGWREDAPR